MTEEANGKLYWVATYGDGGIVVEHFTNKMQWLRAAVEARRGWRSGEFDTYTYEEMERAR